MAGGKAFFQDIESKSDLIRYSVSSLFFNHEQGAKQIMADLRPLTCEHHPWENLCLEIKLETYPHTYKKEDCSPLFQNSSSFLGFAHFWFSFID